MNQGYHFWLKLRQSDWTSSISRSRWDGTNSAVLRRLMVEWLLYMTVYHCPKMCFVLVIPASSDIWVELDRRKSGAEPFGFSSYGHWVSEKRGTHCDVAKASSPFWPICISPNVILIRLGLKIMNMIFEVNQNVLNSYRGLSTNGCAFG